MAADLALRRAGLPALRTRALQQRHRRPTRRASHRRTRRRRDLQPRRRARPHATAKDALAKNRIIAVNLPPQALHGSAGNFLALWAVFALKRILHVADALYAANRALGVRGGRGKKAETSVTIPWPVMPDDHTPNVVEIWASRNGRKQPGPDDVTVKITPPNAGPSALPTLARGQKTSLGGVATLYCPDNGSQRLSYILSVGPTARKDGPAPLAPAGPWRITLDYTGRKITTEFYIQSDQPVLVGSLIGRESYFDHPNDAAFLPDGHLRDSYDYRSGAHTDAIETYGPVQIKGTQNALATSDTIVVIGGHRLSDGEPGSYSSTFDGDDKGEDAARETLDALYPSEIAPSLFGLLASGARDGSVVPYRGTSMATGLATREIADAFALWDPANPDPDLGSAAWLRARALACQSAPERPAHYKVPAALKGGSGQLPVPASFLEGRLARI